MEDRDALQASEWAKNQREKFKEFSRAEPEITLFKVSDFPADAKAPKILQLMRLTLNDKSQVEAARDAWKECATAAGQEYWGGESVGDGETILLGVAGWNSLEVCILCP